MAKITRLTPKQAQQQDNRDRLGRYQHGSNAPAEESDAVIIELRRRDPELWEYNYENINRPVREMSDENRAELDAIPEEGHVMSIRDVRVGDFIPGMKGRYRKILLIDSGDDVHYLALDSGEVLTIKDEWNVQIRTSRDVDTHAAEFVPADHNKLIQQIGRANIFNTVDGRIEKHETGMSIQVGGDYWVTVDATGRNTYTVRSVKRADGRDEIITEMRGVQADELGFTVPDVADRT